MRSKPPRRLKSLQECHSLSQLCRPNGGLDHDLLYAATVFDGVDHLLQPAQAPLCASKATKSGQTEQGPNLQGHSSGRLQNRMAWPQILGLRPSKRPFHKSTRGISKQLADSEGYALGLENPPLRSRPGGHGLSQFRQGMVPETKNSSSNH